MIRHPLLTFLTVLMLAVSGCSVDSTPGEQRGNKASSKPTALVSLPPVNKPLYGQRQDGQPWRSSGHAPQPVTHKPYVDGLLSADILPAPVDEHGIRLYERDGKRYYHPVAIIQYALAKLDVAEQTGRPRAMRAAVKNATKLLDEAVPHNGGLYFPYTFDFPLAGKIKRVIRAPWWSAMAQGQALSLFTRLYEKTGKESWRKAADKTFATMDDRGPRSAPWSVFIDSNRYLWFEEYAGNTAPLLVLNGDMFAIFGLWDYYSLTHSAKAKELFDAGVTTLREYLPLYREPGDVSYYCLRAPYCLQPLWQNEKYHGIVTTQMRIIADMTDDEWFNRQADRFAADYSG